MHSIRWTHCVPMRNRNQKRRLKFCWSCTDFVQHEHRWKWSAWLCGRAQLLWHKIRGRA